MPLHTNTTLYTASTPDPAPVAALDYPLDQAPSMDWFKRELLAYADVHGVEADDSNTKSEILAAIEAAGGE